MMKSPRFIGAVCAGLALLSAISTSQGFAQKGGKSPLVGKDALLISAENTGVILPNPAGYIVDKTAAENLGIPVAYHPKNKNWQTADTVMYVNFARRSDAGIKGVDAIIARDRQAAQTYSSGSTATLAGSGKTTSGISYKMYDFKGVGKAGAQERIAYLNTPDNVTLLVISSKTRSGFQSNVSTYTRWVKTAAYVATTPK